MAEEKKKATKKTTEKKPRAAKKARPVKEEKAEAVEAEVVEAKPEETKVEAGPKKVKGHRKESARAAAPVVKPRPLPRPVEKSTLDLDPETRRLLNARATNKASFPEFRRIDSHKKDKLDPSWRRPRGHHAQLRRKRKSKGATVKAGYGSPAAVNGYHPSGYVEVLVFRPEDVRGIAQTQAIRIAGTVGRKKQLEIERVAREQSIKVLNPLNTFEGAQ
jgi:large subunit ribosomal protein L32e